MRRTIEIIAFAVAVLIAALAVHAWLASRDDERRLESTLATQKQLIDAASARESARDATLQQTLAQIDALKRTTQTPPKSCATCRNTSRSRRLSRFPLQVLRPPNDGIQSNQWPRTNRVGTGSPGESDSSPSPSSAISTASTSRPDASSPGLPASTSASSAEIPAVDLKPLYDYVQDCRACQAHLAAATQNAADDASEIAALTRERDAALTASKGGSFWQRFRRNALWLAVGAGLGYAAHR